MFRQQAMGFKRCLLDMHHPSREQQQSAIIQWPTSIEHETDTSPVQFGDLRPEPNSCDKNFERIPDHDIKFRPASIIGLAVEIDSLIVLEAGALRPRVLIPFLENGN